MKTKTTCVQDVKNGDKIRVRTHQEGVYNVCIVNHTWRTVKGRYNFTMIDEAGEIHRALGAAQEGTFGHFEVIIEENTTEAGAPVLNNEKPKNLKAMKNQNNTPAVVATPELEAVTKGAYITVNDDRFTTGENRVKATYYGLNAEKNKMKITIGGKIAWLTVDKYIGLAPTWQEEQAAKKAAATGEAPAEAQAPAPEADNATEPAQIAPKGKGKKATPAKTAAEVKATVPGVKTAAELPKNTAEFMAEINSILDGPAAPAAPKKSRTAVVTEAIEEALGLTDSPAPAGLPVPEETEVVVVSTETGGHVGMATDKATAAAVADKVTKVGELIIGHLKSIGDEAATLNDIAAGIGRSSAAIKGNLQSLVLNGYVIESNPQDGAFYFLSTKGQGYALTGTGTAKAAKPAKVKSEASQLVDKMFGLWDAGKTDKEIAEELACDISKVRINKTTYVRKRALERGEKIQFTGKEGSTRWQIVKLFDEGKTAAEIAKLVPCDVTYIYNSKHLTLKAK